MAFLLTLQALEDEEELELISKTISISQKKFNYQMSKVSSEGMDVINVSRSENAPCSFVNDLDSLICTERTTYIIGDFNICYNTQKQSKVIKYLEKNGFRYVLIY